MDCVVSVVVRLCCLSDQWTVISVVVRLCCLSDQWIVLFQLLLDYAV